MLSGWVVLPVACAYLCLLFAIAYYGDKRAREGRSLIANPYIYTLSIAVYCTSWTFYGSVGRAAQDGVAFLPIYLGPTLTFVLWWFVLAKILRISKTNRITSIADFISSRYGKSTMISGLVTVIAVVGIMPYIALQLKAVSTSFNLLLHYPNLDATPTIFEVPFPADTAFLVTTVLAIFTILFGTRQIDAAEHHEGMVAAIAFESIVKLVAFLAVGFFVTFGLYGSFADLFAVAGAQPETARLFSVDSDGGYSQWVTLTLLSMAAIICLPRQFQVTVVENVDERHLHKAVWLFPLYLLAINIFVLPIALAGLMQFPGGGVDADTFVLTLPLAAERDGLALFVFIGGLSAATGMVIVATIALSTMVCNDLVMPTLLRIPWLRLSEERDLTGLLLAIRRGSIMLILAMSYIYYRYIGESYALVTIGLVSFAAAAQFAPAIIGGIFWKGGTRTGALIGLSLGFALWAYTLFLPSMARSGWLSLAFVEQGPFGIELLHPYRLFGLDGLDHVTHALFWSLLGNIGGYIVGSLFGRESALERIQAAIFVDVFRHSESQRGSGLWRGTATFADVYDVVVRFLGKQPADRAFTRYAEERNLNLDKLEEADSRLLHFTERLLAGAIGAASARVMLASVVKGEMIRIDEVMQILDETSQVIEYSHRLEQKSSELEHAYSDLRAANQRLTELDRLKDDFISTVSHELRTPLTSIRSFSEILYDNPSLDLAQRGEFLNVIIKESERLTRLINQILDLAKMEAGSMEWNMADLDPGPSIEEALAATHPLFRERGVELEVDLPSRLPDVHADRDRLVQIVVNLLSNAVKFCDPEGGRVTVEARPRSTDLLVVISDNGVGLSREEQRRVFEKFQALREDLAHNLQGTGLGLPICRQIVEHFGGQIWVESEPGKGARFAFTLPYPEAARAALGTAAK